MDIASLVFQKRPVSLLYLSSVFCQVLEFSRERAGSHSPEAPVHVRRLTEGSAYKCSYLKKCCRAEDAERDKEHRWRRSGWGRPLG